MNLYDVEYRYVTPELYMTPTMLIPMQHTFVKAESEDKVLEALAERDNLNLDYIRDYTNWGVRP